MRTDLTFGYALTALFMVSMLIIGAELLFGTGTSISDEEGLLALVDPMQDRFGLLARWAFLIGFWPSRPAPCSEPGTAAPTSLRTVCALSARCRTRRHPITSPKRASSSEHSWPGCRSRP